MKSYEIEIWVEIPIQVHFELHPRERQTMTYPGCDEHIEIDEVTIPDDVQKYIWEKYQDKIETECWEHAKEN